MNFETKRAEKYRHLSSDKKVRTTKGLLAKLQMLLHTVEKGNVRISYVWTTMLSERFSNMFI